MTATDATDLYYDPYDFEIDSDPYPIWRRLREESPLYYNEKYEFFAVSRFDDCEKALVDWRTYSSARGTVLEAYNGQLAAKGCPTFDLESDLQPKDTKEMPRPVKPTPKAAQ